MSARRKARKRALDVLFGADVKEITLAQALEEAEVIAAREPERASSWNYARELVTGVIDHRLDIEDRKSVV